MYYFKSRNTGGINARYLVIRHYRGLATLPQDKISVYDNNGHLIKLFPYSNFIENDQNMDDEVETPVESENMYQTNGDLGSNKSISRISINNNTPDVTVEGSTLELYRDNRGEKILVKEIPITGFQSSYTFKFTQ
jgi:hypothetical protein